MQENKQEKSQIKQNILFYLDKLGISQYEFYKNSGITRGILSQNNGISEENIARFLAYAEDINIEWLLTGKGEMFKNKYSQCNSFNSMVMEDIPHAKKSEDKKEGIPLIPTNAMAGMLSGEITVLDYECERYVIPVFKGADFLINIKGLSMYPKYSPGDIVACKKVPLSGLFFQWGKVYVLDTNQGAIIKKVKPAEKSDHIKIVSENPDYDPFELNVSDIHSIALVIGVVRLE